MENLIDRIEAIDMPAEARLAVLEAIDANRFRPGHDQLNLAIGRAKRDKKMEVARGPAMLPCGKPLVIGSGDLL